MMTGDTSHINYRRAIEALRAGVPNRDAVRLLGSSQPRLEERFSRLMETFQGGIPAGHQDFGMIFAGDFGTGKSHLLERFQHMALEQGFVCSKVVVSKHTPFYKLDKVYRAAIESAIIPGRVGACMSELAITLDTHSETYAEFFKWLNAAECGLCNHFAATVHLYETTNRYDEVIELVTSFWSGHPFGVRELRSELKNARLGAIYKVERVPHRVLAEQRFIFTPRLMKAAGYAGWVILIDETELISSYGIRSRALAYAELPRFIGTTRTPAWPGITSVLAITSDFVAKVLDDRDDEGKIPNKYSSETTMVQRSETGMKLLREATLIERPTGESVKQTWDKLRDIYHGAYGWDPPTEYRAPDLTNSMRQILKRWITEWDLSRLFGHKADIDVKVLSPKMEENPEMEIPTEGETDDNADNR
ncbi:MAG: DUF2791 family P-loop domain-containing protein [Dehalococcoidia bacterium]|nr:DUF2791 family P-loop domain-containing protein [Dehalococcoidia bacterium]